MACERLLLLDNTTSAGVVPSATMRCRPSNNSSSARTITSIPDSSMAGSASIVASPTTCISLVVSIVLKPTRIIGVGAMTNTRIMQPAPVCETLHRSPELPRRVTHASVPFPGSYFELTLYAALARRPKAYSLYQSVRRRQADLHALRVHPRQYLPQASPVFARSLTLDVCWLATRLAVSAHPG